ncbi:OmpA family protein [Flectobacillus roseus]|uniref:OmpA family protein n=1 Tax=Flectobacillus roseus TaxID=502259 RepID=UPI0024B6F78A|nr:OmpA family protein [Flectobacillus roseus]MDI9869625.1 OmpA family protein [Flectobacillus roseus]
MDEASSILGNASVTILNREKSHNVLLRKETEDGSVQLEIEYNKEYHFLVQSEGFFATHLFLSFQEIKNQSLEGDILNTQNTNILVLSKNQIGVLMKRIPYFTFMAKDKHTGEYIEAEYAIRLNKTGAVNVRKMKRGEPLDYLPEMFCSFEVSVRKDNYLEHSEEFLYDKFFKGMEHTFELQIDSTKIPVPKDITPVMLVKEALKPFIPKIIPPAPDLVIPFEQGSFYLTAATQEQLNGLITQLQNNSTVTLRIVGSHDGVGSAKLNSYLAYLRAVVIQIYLDNHSLTNVKTVVQTITNPETDIPLAARRVAKIYIEQVHSQDFISKN